MSTVPFRVRGSPHWSVAGKDTLVVPAARAGLSADSAMVWVGPPLSASGPRSALTLSKSPVAPKPQEPAVLSTRLYPWLIAPF